MSIETTQFQNKVVLVTGAGGGIGRAIARRFGRAGARVVVNDLNAGAAAVAQEIVDQGGSAIFSQANVADGAAVTEMVVAAVDRWGSVDVLVNNAAIVDATRHFLDGDETWWRRIIDVNLTGCYHCAQAVAPIMARQGSGVIINLSSGGATRAHRGFSAYDAAKGGVEALTRALALDLGPYSVRVNALVPGSIDTSGMDAETRRRRGADIPLGRVGDPDDLAGPALFLASDDARYITGHCLAVDGGMLSQQRSATVDIFPLENFPNLEQRS